MPTHAPCRWDRSELTCSEIVHPSLRASGRRHRIRLFRASQRRYGACLADLAAICRDSRDARASPRSLSRHPGAPYEEVRSSEAVSGRAALPEAIGSRKAPGELSINPNSLCASIYSQLLQQSRRADRIFCSALRRPGPVRTSDRSTKDAGPFAVPRLARERPRIAERH